MFNCVPSEQTVAMRKTKFLKRVSNSNNMLSQTFAVEAAKEQWRPNKVLYIS